MSSLARWCLRRRSLILAVWVAALVVLLAVDLSAKPAFATKFSLPNTPSTSALNILKQEFPSASGDADQIVVQAKSGTLSTPATEAQVSSMLRKVAVLPHVATVVSPYSAVGGSQIAKGDTIGFARVNFDEQVGTLPNTAVRKVISTAQSADSSTLNVALSGQAIENGQKMKQSDGTAVGIVVALIVLLLAFGALFAALLPLVTALVAIGTGYAITGLLTHVMSVASFASLLGVLIGLGVGVDYALFIVTRHRKGLRAGRAVEDSVTNSVNTAGRAVFFAGLTVCIALLGQFALGVSFLYGVAVSAAITVALTMLASLTLLPALLGFFKYRVLNRQERLQLGVPVNFVFGRGEATAPYVPVVKRFLAKIVPPYRPVARPVTGPISEEAKGFWFRWAKSIERGPAIRAAAGLLLIVVIALPILTLRLGLADAGSDPPSTTTRQAYDLLAKGFGPGVSGPFELVARINSPADETAFKQLAQTVAAQPGVVQGTPPRVAVSPNGKAAEAIIYPTTSPQAVQTTSLLSHLRDQVVPQAEKGTTLQVLIGGATAGGVDFAHVLSSKLPQFVAVVVILAFLLLMTVFRSLVIPFVASIMNLLSVGAALGIMNVVFEWGWGKSIFGITRTGPVEVFIPVIMFSILFGLSMDYEVFLVSRIQEEWARRHDNTEAVTRGQAETGRVITAAALIMIFVFASFLLGGTVVIDQFGIGLAGAIVVDAFIVRTLLVPSLMHLLGRSNWWLPSWLDRILPQLHVETPDEPILIEEPATVGSASS